MHNDTINTYLFYIEVGVASLWTLYVIWYMYFCKYLCII